MKSHSGADACAAQDVAKLMQRLAEYTLGLILEWEESERVRPDQKADAYVPTSSMRTPRTACVCEARDCGWGCYRNRNNQAQSIQCWIVRAKRLQQEVNGKVVIFW